MNCNEKRNWFVRLPVVTMRADHAGRFSLSAAFKPGALLTVDVRQVPKVTGVLPALLGGMNTGLAQVDVGDGTPAPTTVLIQLIALPNVAATPATAAANGPLIHAVSGNENAPTPVCFRNEPFL